MNKEEENKYFWTILRTYNTLMKESIEGPDCTDPEVCNGGCCSIHIDVPKVLAEKYIELGYADKEDFIRSNIFAFKFALDEDNNKCVLFDEELNGCSVHHTGIKPMQCWIYPTRFSNSRGEDIKCKNADGWRIIDEAKIKEAEKLLDQYKFLCKLEKQKELKLIKKRIRRGEKNSLISEIQDFKPSEIGGFRDCWDTVKPLSAEGYSLQLKKFCIKYNPECTYLPDSFMECNKICIKIAKKLITFLKKHLFEFIRKREADVDGEYPFFKLFKFAGLNQK